MDFLDPRKKKTRTIRLMVGYFLMAVAIGLGTVVLVYGASGYGIDTKTGQITENSLLFVDSRPGGAGILLNGIDQKTTTSARMVLNAGDYDINIRKPGYREWSRSFTLNERSIKRFVYPYLFPEKLNPKIVKNYSSIPQLVSITPDRRFMLVQNQAITKNLNFDVYETGEIDRPAQPINLPATLLTGYDPASSKLTEVEWASDNTHLLIQHISAIASEYIIIDRTNPTDSLNINKQFKANLFQVTLRDKRINELYIYDQATRTLRIANVNQKKLEPVLLNDVHAYKTYGRTIISYVTSAGSGKMATHVWDDGKSYPLNTIAAGTKYLLDIAEFQSNWYYVAASDADPRVNIYKNPLDLVRDSRIKAAPPMVAFDISAASKVSFSANTRFLNVQSGQKFGVYDFEANEKYQYEVAVPLAGPMEWMDGHRLIGSSGGLVVVIDYDSTNPQTLIPTLLADGGYFSRDFNQFYTLAPSSDGASTSITRTDMRAGDDLPEPLR